MCSRFNNDVAERLADRHDGAKERDHIRDVIRILRRELGAKGFMPR